ncbi:MAG TPA: cell surface protein SprA [Longimicrobiales bacterium]|nr:cell surface protein SprA [Longimicrobiales bacterium]
MLIRVILVIVCLSGAAGSLAAQQRDERLLPPITGLEFRSPPALRLFARRPFTDWVQEWTVATRLRLDEQERAMLHGRSTFEALGPLPSELSPERPAEAVAAEPEAPEELPDTVNYLPPPPRLPTPGGRVPGLGEYAQLGIRLNGRGDLGSEWTRYSPCDPTAHLNCNPGLVPDLKPEMLFGVQVAGTISQRVHVDVDYDQRREFDAANNLNVYYQGLPDEILRRVEVGDVSFRLPSSRFLTRGIPTGNFGFLASSQLGPMEMHAVFAQQRGDVSTREFRLAGGGQQGLVQDARVVLDDVDYVKAQFFFLVPPDQLAGAPHVDALALRNGDAPAAISPSGGEILVFRDERIPPGSGQQNAQLGYFLARAVPWGGGVSHSGTFRRLVPEQDYTLHASGLWFMLRAPLRAEEALAVAFTTATGEMVGDVNAEQAPAGSTPELRLLRGPGTTHQPGSPTWPLEMHQVYRLDSSNGVDANAIEMTISLGEASSGLTYRESNGERVTFLKLFGMDEDAPADRPDAAQLFQPAGSDPQAPIGGTYVIFPTLQPFLEPAPVPSVALSAAQAAELLGRDANRAIYEEVDPVTRQASGRFRLTFQYRVAVDGLVTSFSLGALAIREESERITLGGRRLERGTDYTIDYDLGQVTLLNAQTLFGANPDAEIRANWEQKPLFQLAPTSVFGLNTRFQLAERGELNFVTLYQAEKSLMTRPQLGVEPGAIFLGGVSGHFDLGGAALTRALDLLPGLRLDGESRVRLTGEMAFSAPRPNTRGTAYLDDFESSDELRIQPRRSDWRLGSAPESTTGDEGTLPPALDAASAVPLVWQHDFVDPSGQVGGALFPRQHIDRQIAIAGKDVLESVLWLTLGDPAGLPPAPDPRRWRSITQVLSTTGIDLSRSEYLEFYVSAAFGVEPLALIFDVGTVSEDALYIDPDGRTEGTYEDGTPWGLGILDEEARLAEREVWSRELDARGLWNQPCISEPARPYPLGDARSNCTRGNGLRDTEDLNGNGVADFQDGAYFRYVVQLDQASPYLVRDTSATGTIYRLYRVPLRAAGTPLNGANDATWRFIKHLRLTVAGQPTAARVLSLARMRIVGSRWSKRDVTGVVHGMLDDGSIGASAATRVRVGPVSQLTDGGRYRPPPGVVQETQDLQSGIGTGGIEYNEKSLRIAYDDLEPEERAEAFFHYAQQPRSFLTYRQLRLWAVAREGEWGTPQGERLLVKLGTDARNYYLYQTPLRTATGPRAVQVADWVPEVVIDFQPWLDLKTLAERRMIERGPQAEQDTVWSADSTYAIVYENRARAPNLAAIRELSLAVYNAGGVATSGEVWINDMRLGAPSEQSGTATMVGLEVRGGDFVNATVTYARQSDVFQQLNETPSYVGTGDLGFSAAARLDRFLPAAWGVELPFNVSHSRSQQDPSFLSGSDVLADRMEGLRETGTSNTHIGVSLRKATPTANPWLGLLLDGSALRIGYTTNTARAVTSRAEASGLNGDLSYSRSIAPRAVGLMPGFLESVLRALAPGPIERSDVFQRLVDSQLRYTPAAISLGASYNDQQSRSYLYDRILALPGDTAVRPVESPRRGLRNHATLALRPFEPLDASLSLSSDRDLLDPARATQRPDERMALERARGGLAGIDLGWERANGMQTSFNYRPQLAGWLNSSYTWNARYASGRNPSYLEERVRIEGDTIYDMQRRFEADRRSATRLQLRPNDLIAAVFGAPDTSATGAGALARRALGRLQPFDLSWSRALNSAFEREAFTPALGYRLGMNDLHGFRIIDADTAVRAQLRDEFRAGTGIALPSRTRLDLSYSDVFTEVFDARGGRRESSERTWPSLTLNNGRLPLPGRLGTFFSIASGSIGLARVERRTLLAAQERGGEELRVPLSLSLGTSFGLVVQYTGSITVSENYEATGRSESGTNMHAVNMSGIFRLPGSLGRSFREPLRAQLSFTQSGQDQCRVLASSVFATGDCAVFNDITTRNARLDIETTLKDVDFGLFTMWNSRDNRVGLASRTNQFQLGMFASFNLEAGQMPLRRGGFR